MTPPLHLGDEAFWLDTADAAEVQRIYAFDQPAELTLARRRAQKASVTVPMMLMDAAPAAPSRPLHDAAPSLPLVQPPRITPMNVMSKIRIGDRDHYVDPNVAREIEMLRGANAALTAIAQGAVQPPVAQPVVDAFTASKLAARDAVRAEEARNNDPSTLQGKYRQYLSSAYRNAR